MSTFSGAITNAHGQHTIAPPSLSNAIPTPVPVQLAPSLPRPSPSQVLGARTQHGAPARFIDTQGAGLLAAHRRHRGAQATAACIVPLQLAEVHAASAAATSCKNES